MLYFKKIILVGLLITTQLLNSMNFSHHDWEVTCDNTNTCRIAGYSPYYASLPISVLLTSKAGSQESIEAKVQLGNFSEEVDEALSNLSPTFQLTLFINEQNYGDITMNKNNLISPLTKEQTTALLSSLRKNSKIIWKTDKYSWQLSDKGSTAVLLKVDEFQKRLGTTKALYKQGDKSKNLLLNSKPIPTITAPKLLNNEELELSSSQMEQLGKQLILSEDSCFNSDILSSKITLYKLSSNKLLATKLCWQAAYNAASAYWLIDNKAPFNPKLISTEGNHYSLDEHGIGTISANHKGRGIGDCWSYKNLVWNGKSFQQSSLGTTGQCRAIAGGGAWDLPSFVSTLKTK